MNQKKVTPDEFAKKYRELFDMASMIDGIDRVEFTINTHGRQSICDEIKALIDLESAQGSLERIRRDKGLL